MKIQDSVAREFIQHAVYQMNENLPRIDKCLAQLSEQEVWSRPNPSSNSIGNLILHLNGNIRQWIVSSLGNQDDVRNRSAEFDASDGHSKEALLHLIRSTVVEAIQVIQQLDEEQLLMPKSVQGFQYSALGNVLHVVEHFSYHVGQIAYYTKILKGKDLGFYADNNALNQKNE